MTKKTSKPIDLENPLEEEEALLKDESIEGPVHSIDPYRLPLNEGEEFLDGIEGKGILYADKHGNVKFRTFKQHDQIVKDREWVEPEPNPQLNPFEAMALPKEVTKHHL